MPLTTPPLPSVHHAHLFTAQSGAPASGRAVVTQGQSSVLAPDAPARGVQQPHDGLTVHACILTTACNHRVSDR